MKRMRLWKKIAAAAIIVCALTFIYLQVQVIVSQNHFTPQKADVILVLGHSLEGEMEQPDQWLIERLAAAIHLYNEGYATKLIVSGGKGHTYRHSVANAMRNWLVEQGMPEEDILLEESAKNTCQNFSFSKQLMEENGLASAIVVTNDFHMYRSMRIGNDYINEISGYAAPVKFSFQKLLAYLKEPLSVIKYYAIDRFIN